MDPKLSRTRRLHVTIWTNMHTVDVRLHFGVGFDWVLRRNDTRNEDLAGASVIIGSLAVVCRVELVGVTGSWEGEGEAWRRGGGGGRRETWLPKGDRGDISRLIRETRRWEGKHEEVELRHPDSSRNEKGGALMRRSTPACGERRLSWKVRSYKCVDTGKPARALKMWWSSNSGRPIVVK